MWTEAGCPYSQRAPSVECSAVLLCWQGWAQGDNGFIYIYIYICIYLYTLMGDDHDPDPSMPVQSLRWLSQTKNGMLKGGPGLGWAQTLGLRAPIRPHSPRSPEQKYLRRAQKLKKMSEYFGWNLLNGFVCVLLRSNVMAGEWTHLSQLYNFEAIFMRSWFMTTQLVMALMPVSHRGNRQVQVHSGVPITNTWSNAEAAMPEFVCWIPPEGLMIIVCQCYTLTYTDHSI